MQTQLLQYDKKNEKAICIETRRPQVSYLLSLAVQYTMRLPWKKEQEEINTTSREIQLAD